MKSAPSAPAAPDYGAAAKQQGAANTETAQATAYLGNPNVYSPYGNQTVSYQASPYSFDQAGYMRARDLAANTPGMEAPDQSKFTMGGNQIPTVTQTLNPQSQAIFDAQQQSRLGLANLSQQGIGTAQQTLGQPFSFGGPNVQTSLGGFGAPQGAPDLSQYGQASGNVGAGQGIAGAPNLQGMGQAQGSFWNPNVQSGISGYGSPQTSLNTSGIANMPVNAGTTGQQAIMARLQPQLEQQRNMEETRLRNQGLVAGGEAYNDARRNLDQSQNDALSQAALYGINLDMSANQQGFGQALSQGQFGNQAQQQQYGQNLGAGQFANQAAGQQFGQNLAAGQFGNQALAQNQQAALMQQQAQNQAQNQGFSQQFSQQGMQNQAISQNQNAALQQQQAGNAAQQQQYQQALQSGQFANTAQQQALQQALYQRNLPLNEIAALMSGSQIQNPQFQGYQGSQIQPAPTFNAAGQQAQYNQGLYNSQVGSANSANSGLMNLAGSALGAYGSYAGLAAMMA